MRIGIEIGGTFTDLILLRDGQTPTTLKVSSTPWDPSEGALNGVRKLLEKTGVAWGEVEEVLHGSTVATNSLIERKGVRVALLTTKGFEDVLLIGRQEKTRIYDQFYRRSPPLVEREAIYGIPERLDADGRIVQPLDEKALVASVRRAVEERGATSIAVSFLHAYRNPAHEHRARELIEATFADLDVSLSSVITPEFREYERTSTTVINAYVRPVIRRYVTRMQDALLSQGYRRDLMIMQSNGGVLPAEVAARLPVRMFLSGPAAGVAGASFIARHCGIGNLLTMDIGGTSCDIALIADFQAMMASKGLAEYRIDGHPINIRMMDITTIGAGGGSIAWIDDGGMLHVGPQSAGAQPGPACYAREGADFTLTDALVILGLVDPARFLGGEMHIDPALSVRASGPLAARLNMSAEELALSVFRIAIVNIAQAVRQTTVQRGRDPRDFAILPYGGGGAIFAASVAEVMEIESVVVPPNPGIFSAYGLTVSEIRLDYTQADPGRKLASLDSAAITAVFDALAVHARSEFQGFGVTTDLLVLSMLVDARYIGQGFELTVAVDPTELGRRGPGAIAEAFHAAHSSRYGYSFREQDVEIVNYRLEAAMPREGVLPEPARTVAKPTPRPRTVRLNGAEQWGTYERSELPVGAELDGPAMIFESTTATAVPTGWRLHVDTYGNLHLTRRNSRKE
ncbi:hydantoinase/oxoprolinase family protein [Bradyrhizobium sp. LHD-71]|uniref:hydantoinase/oxoprolinase family protein n=1 Tax=Bradyrhizobium sp. LHD-71 TaxID=3072141 RepID=UPI00280FFB69|nr:hydantoinase/oxoprolinase family protein [Bradyrhizobium sp. LHD-71]MDQ8727520.1 hydantoinase/oxoprolinase family protein [Bradyrhizobium sp. LHD-71]